MERMTEEQEHADQERKARPGSYPRCPQCGQEIQSDMAACPHCGRDLT